jgi:8-amino-7-oxononanoate synthase
MVVVGSILIQKRGDTMIQPQSISRREVKRYKYEGKNIILQPIKDNTNIEGKIVNISNKGLLGVFNKPINTPQRVNIQINVGHGVETCHGMSLQQGKGKSKEWIPQQVRDDRKELMRDNNEAKTTEIKGRVMWCYEDENKKYKYGINFIEDQNIFKTFLNNRKENDLTYDDRRTNHRRKSAEQSLDNNKRKNERRITKPIFEKCVKNKWIDFIKKQNTWFREYETSAVPHAIMEGRKMLSYSYCNYLGLSEDIRIKEAMISAIKKYGTGINCSPLSCGTMNIHRKLEKRFTEFILGEACILYPLGYVANGGALTAIANINDTIIVDEKSHASIIDGCLLSKAKLITYKHNDMDDLKKCLEKSKGNKLVVSDGVFSMDGDIIKLDDVYELAQKYNAGIFLDDAHGIGVVGKNGRGTAEYFGLEGKIDLIMGTFAKAIPLQGGFIVGKQNIINYLKYTSRPYIFNMSLQPYLVEGVIKTLDIIENEPQHRNRLWDNVSYMKKNLIRLGFKVKESHSAIIPIFIGNNEKTCQIGYYLTENGVMVDSVTYPIVKKSEAMLRIVMSTLHTKKDIDITLNYLEKSGKSFGVI